MSLEDDIAFFEQVPTFAALGKQALRILAIGAETRQLTNGSVLFYAGEAADGGYVVLDGALVLEPSSSLNDERFVAGPGTLVSERALFADTMCSSTAIARGQTTVIRISRSLFRKMMEGYPEAAQKLRDVMAARVDGWMRELGAVKRRLEGSG
jgi:CRP-like cAMP-binding protein